MASRQSGVDAARDATRHVFDDTHAALAGHPLQALGFPDGEQSSLAAPTARQRPLGYDELVEFRFAIAVPGTLADDIQAGAVRRRQRRLLAWRKLRACLAGPSAFAAKR